jgi:phosphate:Na+ symporter
LQKVLDETHGYLDLIHIRNSEGREFQQLIALFHALDHMQRLHERCDEDLERALTASSNTALRQVEKILESNIDRVIAEVSSDNWQTAVTISTENFEEIKLLVQPQREKIYHLVARGNLTVPESTDCAEALRWMSRVSHHLARICFYLHKYNNGHG